MNNILILPTKEFYQTTYLKRGSPYYKYGWITFVNSELANDEWNYSDWGAVTIIADDIESAESGFIMPTQPAIKNALDYAKMFQDVVVTCEAGISRSAAMAVLIAYAKTQSLEFAVSVLKSNSAPNRLILRHGERILGAAGIVDAVERWATTP